MIPPEVAAVLDAAPEFTQRYLEVVEAFDDDPGAAAAFGELADYAAALALEVDRVRPLLARLMEGVETAARLSDDPEEVIGWGFLDALSPDDLRRLAPFMGPTTRAVLDALELA